METKIQQRYHAFLYTRSNHKLKLKTYLYNHCNIICRITKQDSNPRSKHDRCNSYFSCNKTQLPCTTIIDSSENHIHSWLKSIAYYY